MMETLPYYRHISLKLPNISFTAKYADGHHMNLTKKQSGLCAVHAIADRRPSPATLN